MNTTTVTTCKLCARTNSGICTRCAKKRSAALRIENDKIVATGKCPCCGTALVRNLALAGWWQCGGYGSPGFRKPGFENVAACSFQVFGS